MIAYTLRYSNELRDEQDYFRDLKAVEINEESLELAEALIAKKSTKLDLSKFEDGYEVAVKELIEAKVNKMPVPKEEVAEPRGKVVNLMDALRKSLGGADSWRRQARSKEARGEREGRFEEGHWVGETVLKDPREEKDGLAQFVNKAAATIELRAAGGWSFRKETM